MISLRGVAKRFEELSVLENLSLDIPDNRMTVLLGPSGCGKTTLLDIISGTLKADAGEIAGMEGRRISYLFQEPRLLPWKTVEQNLDLVLRDLYTEPERRRLITETLAAVGLAEFAGYYPDALSGGMRQRAAMARAFVYPGEILLMDEPFQALDLHLKIALTKAFDSLWREDKRTGIFVTHDIHEALMLGDGIVVFSSRPAHVVDMITNDVPHGERSLRHEGILNMEKRIYRSLAAGEGESE